MSAGVATPFSVLALAATIALVVYAALRLRRSGTRSEWRGLAALSSLPLALGLLGAILGHMAGLDWVVALGPAHGAEQAAEAASWVRVPLLSGALGTAVTLVVAGLGCRRSGVSERQARDT